MNLIGFANCRVELCLKPDCSEYWGAEADKQCQDKIRTVCLNDEKKPHLDPFNCNIHHIKLSPFLCVCMGIQVTCALKQTRYACVRQHQVGTQLWFYQRDKIRALVWKCVFRVLFPRALMHCLLWLVVMNAPMANMLDGKCRSFSSFIQQQ